MGRRILKYGSGLALCLAVAGYVAAWWVPLPERLMVADSPAVTYRDGTWAYVFLAPDERFRITPDLQQIDERYITALVAVEDHRFWWHPGVDPLAIGRAAVQNLTSGDVISGGSTLTMQLARMLEPRPRRLSSKVLEALRAVQLEIRLSKSEILAQYLRFAPYGRNLESLDVAALTYFGHRPTSLTEAEIATLLAVPQRPNARYPSPAHHDALRNARSRVAQRLQHHGVFSDHPTDVRTRQDALVPPALRPLPRQAPHVAWWMRGAGTVVSTLDATVQRTAEHVLAEHAALARQHGVSGAAVVVVERSTGHVAGLVGGFDFWSGEPGSQIPGFAVARSPGSTLKPLLFAMAVDHGLVLPDTLVEDIPVRYGQYRPQNYDGTFAGMTTLADALSQSLNVPFINLLNTFGVENFLGRLASMGADRVRTRPGSHGLSLIAGGIEVSPLELAGMYQVLAGEGAYRALQIEEGSASAAPITMLSPGAAWLTQQVLSRRDRPDFPIRASVSATVRRVWWKTGTSFGNRDAWAVGAGEKYVVAVWLGNMDHTSRPWLVGGPAAGPVLFDVLEALGDDRGEPPSPPADLSPVRVCALSGHVPTEICPHQETVSALQRIPSEPCPYHQRITVDVETGQRLTPGCRTGREVAEAVRVVWPPDVRRWLTDHRILLDAAPPLAPDCTAPGMAAPRIRSPRRGEVVLLIPGLPPEQQEVPLEADAMNGTLSWYVDGLLLGQTPADERLWWTPRLGTHEVVVTDQAGRSDRTALTVRQGG